MLSSGTLCISIHTFATAFAMYLKFLLLLFASVVELGLKLCAWKYNFLSVSIHSPKQPPDPNKTKCTEENENVDHAE